MQHLHRIKKLNDRRSNKILTSSELIKNNRILLANSKSMLTNKINQEVVIIKNLDDNQLQIYEKQKDFQNIIKNIDQLPSINVFMENLWSKYLNDREREQEQFLQACYQGDVDKVKKIVQGQSKYPIQPALIKTTEGKNGLHLATMSGSYRNVEIIVEIDEKTFDQLRTPLMLGTILGNIIAVKSLIEQGANIKQTDFQGNTALHLACIFNQQKIVQLFFQHHMPIYIQNKQQLFPFQCTQNPQILQQFNSDQNYKRIVLKNQELVLANSRYDHVQKLLSKGSEKDLIISQTEASMNRQRISANKQRHQKIRNIMIKDVKEVQLKDFEKKTLLGRGAFGEVYLVRNINDQKLHAMKVLDKKKIIRQNILKYIMTQKKILSTINHPFILHLDYALQNQNKLFLIMEYCPGGDLLKLIRKLGKIPEQQLKLYVAEILLAIQALHRAQIIYRDLKPGNIVFDADGHACLTDFGLAKEASLAHSFCGTVAYLSPEMIYRKGHTKVIDWYLLGVIIYQGLTGKPPFWDINRQKLTNNIRSGKYLPLPQSSSKQVQDICQNLIKADPKKRLGSSGSKQIKSHPWFKNINWQKAQRKQLPVPKLPNVQGKVLKQQKYQQPQKKSEKILDWQYTRTQK